MRWEGLIGIVALASALGACTETRGPLGFQCERNAECQSPLVCRLTRCRIECATNRDCPIHSLCVFDEAGVGACRLEDEATCAQNNECPDPLACLGGACTNECTTDRDCPAGAQCDPMTLGCVDLAEMVCALDSDCGALACTLDRRCRDECRDNRDCRFGAFCDDGACAPIPAGMDAGVDAGFDAGAPIDAGDVDAGFDAGAPIDAGTDAGISAPTCMGPADCPPPPNARFDCVSGVCTITSCQSYMEDCDGDFTTGCESHPPTDIATCGTMCGAGCGAGEVCAGSCVMGTVAEIDLGHAMGCARFTTGHVVCWGWSQYGQLGDGSAPFMFIQRPAPQLVAGISDATQIIVSRHAVGTTDQSHACALRSGGTVECWGSNVSGQTGTGPTLMGERRPVPVPGLSNVVEIAGLGAATCARRMDGSVACWGEQSAGRLGNGQITPASVITPTTLAGLMGPVGLVHTGGPFGCAELGASNYQCWGGGGGQLGTGDTIGVPTPVAATALLPLGMSGLEGGLNTMFGIDATGNVRCWGSARAGLCGPMDGVAVVAPYQYPTPTGVVQVAAGDDTAVARLSTGEIRCWGRNDLGQCGLGRTDSPIRTPEGPPGITDVTDVAVGGQHMCIVRASGGIWCTGLNTSGQLGNGAWGLFGPLFSSSIFTRVVGIP